MEANIKQISILINEKEANSIRNALIKALGDDVFNPKDENKGASDLFTLLTGSFENCVSGVHTTK